MAMNTSNIFPISSYKDNRSDCNSNTYSNVKAVTEGLIVNETALLLSCMADTTDISLRANTEE